MGEREDVSKKKRIIYLGGQDREVRFGFTAWERIQDDFGDITGLAEKMKTDGPKTMLTLFEVCLVIPKEETRPSREQIREWLDEFDFGELIEMSKTLMSCVTKSVPTAKEGDVKALPTKAEGQ
jgi:hypothetical protein